MTKNSRLTLIMAMVLLLTTLVIWTSQARADRPKIIDPATKEQITKTIDAYFNIRYHALSALQLEGFGELVENSDEGRAFLNSEHEKLDIEIYHSNLFGLRYLQYKYFLDFREIHIDESAKTATASVVEGHDVVFEASEPIVSTMRNRQHIFILRKENDAWKIVSDSYEDYLWRLIRTTGQSREKILRSIDAAFNMTKNENTSPINHLELQNLSSIGIYPYYRDGAVTYAHRWAHDRNLKNYHDFSGEGGDCTNFVSQAMREGGNALMVFTPNPRPEIGGPGWYYASYTDRSAAWNNVGRLFSFLVDETWELGPDAMQVSDKDYTLAGDLIQFNWNDDTVWDHSVIIVGYRDPEYEYLPLVASHSEDHDNYPYTSFSYQGVRFIHIRWNRGYQTYVSVILNNVIGMSGLMGNIYSNPYPSPMDFVGTSKLLPYPAP